MKTLALIFCLLFSAPAIAGSTYHVSKSGSDGNSGSLASPWITILHARTRIAGGDTLFIHAGTYTERFNSSEGQHGDSLWPKGSSWSAPTVIMRYQTDSVILRPTGSGEFQNVAYFGGINSCYIELNGLTLDGINQTDNVVRIRVGNDGQYSTTAAHHIRLKNCDICNAPTSVETGGVVLGNQGTHHLEFINCKIHGGGFNEYDHGVYLQGSYCLLDGCSIYNNWAYGIHFNLDGLGDSVHNNTVRNCAIYNNSAGHHTGAGIYDMGDSNLIYNNVIYGNYGGIWITSSGTNNKVWNNTLFRNNQQWEDARGAITIASSANHTFVQNNLMYDNVNGNISDNGLSNTVDHNVTSWPSFADTTARNFHLLEGSTAIGAGTVLTEFTTDRDGVTRGATWDAGAYEYVAYVPPEEPPATSTYRIISRRR